MHFFKYLKDQTEIWAQGRMTEHLRVARYHGEPPNISKSVVLSAMPPCASPPPRFWLYDHP